MKTNANCVECGKVTWVHEGTWTEWRDREKLSHPAFFCYTCLNRIVQESRDRRHADVLAFRQSLVQEAINQPSLKVRENDEMAQVLRELCQVPSWYALAEITEKYQKYGYGRDPRAVSHILRRIGFTQRARKKQGSYMHVYIDPSKIPKGEQSKT